MTRGAPFLNNQWLWPVIVIAVIVWLVFIWKEKNKYPAAAFFVNSGIALLAIVALALIALKPLKSGLENQFKKVILTKGYSQNQLDSLKQAHPKLTLLKYSPGAQLINRVNIPEAVFILGHGIALFDYWQLDGIPTAYLKGKEPEGIINLNYKTTNTVGNRALLTGVYLNAKKGHKLVLEGPGGTAIDSLLLSAEKKQEFKLSTPLKAAGTILYQLAEKDSLNNTISKNPVPITIANEKLLRIVIINNFPTFETKYLKNYLSKKGHQVLSRSQLTTARYKYEYFNMKSRAPVAFNQKSLAAFDLLIIDANSLNQLSGRNRNAIERSVREDGLGVYIQPEADFFNATDRWPAFNFQKDKNTISTLAQWPKVNINSYPYTFKPEFSLQAIPLSNSKTVAAYKRLGLGRIGTSVLKNTYELVLKSHPEVYEALWSVKLDRLAKKELPTSVFSSPSFVAFENEPTHFVVRTQTQQPQAYAEDIPRIPLKQDVGIASLWRGSTYPKSIGWHSLKIEQDSTAVLNYYITDSTAWSALRANSTTKANERHFKARKNVIKNSAGPVRPWNPLWLFAVFIFCAGYLWLAPKL